MNSVFVFAKEFLILNWIQVRKFNLQPDWKKKLPGDSSRTSRKDSFQIRTFVFFARDTQSMKNSGHEKFFLSNFNPAIVKKQKKTSPHPPAPAWRTGPTTPPFLYVMQR